MEIYWYGQSFFKLKGKTATVVVDPYEAEFTGLKLPKDLTADLALKTHDHQDHNNLKIIEGNPLQITGPGEYESKGVVVEGVQVFHDNQNGAERGKNTVYNINMDSLNIVHLGDIGHLLTEEEIEQIGTTDILLIPVGGTYTIDAKTATEIVAQLEPRIVIPMHYGIPDLKFPLERVESFLKAMGLENIEPQVKLVITRDKLPDEPQVILLAKSS